jgi:predicted ATPase with chaperone activity
MTSMKPNRAAVVADEGPAASELFLMRQPAAPAHGKRPRVEEGVERPLPPLSDADLGIPPLFLQELVLKSLHVRGASTGDALSGFIKLPFWALDPALMGLQRQRLAQVLHSDGLSRRGCVFELTSEGRTRAREIFEASPYVGPAPVPIERYRFWMERLAIRKSHIGPEQVQKAMSHLVLSPGALDVIGPAINSARSVFLYGDPGNGKTSVAEAVVNVFSDSIYVPWAVYADGEVVQLYDPVIHHALDEDPATQGSDLLVAAAPDFDERFVRIRRPLVMVGGELTLSQLELQYDPRSGCYQAPPQMKANGGVFLIDDFGRQQVAPRDLLNRWMVPLDRGIDFLTFPSGRRVSIPFTCVVFFATNLNPTDIVEEAFLRRIRYRVKLASPDRTQYGEIFERVCKARGVVYRPEVIEWLFRNFYEGMGIVARACHPGDIVSDILDLADHLGKPHALTNELVQRACKAYFLDAPSQVERRIDFDRRGDANPVGAVK